MERMLVVVFDNELKAYDGYRALAELDSEGSISVHAQAVIKKDDDGKVTVKQKGEDFPIRTVGGTAIGALIGLLGGPIGLSIGALAGTFAGSVLDMNRAGVKAAKAASRLRPCRVLVVNTDSYSQRTIREALKSTVNEIVFTEPQQEWRKYQITCILYKTYLMYYLLHL
jgi:uncharacterized membrane protein